MVDYVSIGCIIVGGTQAAPTYRVSRLYVLLDPTSDGDIHRNLSSKFQDPTRRSAETFEAEGGLMAHVDEVYTHSISPYGRKIAGS